MREEGRKGEKVGSFMVPPFSFFLPPARGVRKEG